MSADIFYGQGRHHKSITVFFPADLEYGLIILTHVMTTAVRIWLRDRL